MVCAAGVAVSPILMASKWSSVWAEQGCLTGRVSPVAFVGDHNVEGMDRERQPGRTMFRDLVKYTQNAATGSGLF